MELATGAMASLAPKLGELLVEEYVAQKGLKPEIESLSRELVAMDAECMPHRLTPTRRCGIGLRLRTSNPIPPPSPPISIDTGGGIHSIRFHLEGSDRQAAADADPASSSPSLPLPCQPRRIRPSVRPSIHPSIMSSSSQGQGRSPAPAAAFDSGFRPPSKRRRAPACNKAILGLRQITAAADCPSTECAICLRDFDFDSSDTELSLSLRALPCSHAFHQDCISQWLRRNAVCPLCRYQLPTEEEEDFYFDDAEEVDEQERRFRRRWRMGPGIRAHDDPPPQDDQDFIDWQDRHGFLTEHVPSYREPVLDAEAVRLRRIIDELYRRYL